MKKTARPTTRPSASMVRSALLIAWKFLPGRRAEIVDTGTGSLIRPPIIDRFRRQERTGKENLANVRRSKAATGRTDGAPGTAPGLCRHFPVIESRRFHRRHDDIAFPTHSHPTCPGGHDGPGSRPSRRHPSRRAGARVRSIPGRRQHRPGAPPEGLRPAPGDGGRVAVQGPEVAVPRAEERQRPHHRHRRRGAARQELHDLRRPPRPAACGRPRTKPRRGSRCSSRGRRRRSAT